MGIFQAMFSTGRDTLSVIPEDVAYEGYSSLISVTQLDWVGNIHTGV
jgi:hypothetical protein